MTKSEIDDDLEELQQTLFMAMSAILNEKVSNPHYWFNQDDMTCQMIIKIKKFLDLPQLNSETKLCIELLYGEFCISKLFEKDYPCFLDYLNNVNEIINNIVINQTGIDLLDLNVFNKFLSIFLIPPKSHPEVYLKQRQEIILKFFSHLYPFIDQFLTQSEKQTQNFVVRLLSQSIRQGLLNETHPQATQHMNWFKQKININSYYYSCRLLIELMFHQNSNLEKSKETFIRNIKNLMPNLCFFIIQEKDLLYSETMIDFIIQLPIPISTQQRFELFNQWIESISSSNSFQEKVFCDYLNILRSSVKIKNFINQVEASLRQSTNSNNMDFEPRNSKYILKFDEL